MKNEIIIFDNQEVKLEVNMQDETVWLSLEQMSKLFDRDKSVISRHINKVLKEELDESTVAFFATVQKEGEREVTRNIEYYNLDVIISVGYKVNSKQGIIFRKWANKVLKDYLIKGYALNEKRLQALNKTIELINMTSRIKDDIDGNEAKEVLNVISNYTKALDLLDDYDHKALKKHQGTKSSDIITYENCCDLIEHLRFVNDSNIFGLERDNGLSSVINNIYQSFDNKDLYETIEEKAANFLYLIIKNHIYVDGNKRIGATLFIYFLYYYNILYKDNLPIIDNNTLAALTLLIASSNPKEKETMIDIILNIMSN